MKLRKLNAKGFSHDLMVLAFVVIFAIVGVGYLVASHAATTAYTSTNEFSKFQYVLGSGTTAPLTHANSSNLLLQFNKGVTGYHASDMALYQFNLPANTTASSITMNVSYVNAGYDTVFLAAGSPTTKVWSVSKASTQTNKTVTVSLANKPTVIYFGISGKGSSGGFSGSFPANRNLTVNSYTLTGVTTTQTPTVSLSANPTSVSSGSSSSLTWSSTNATSCTASGAWSGSQATSGTVSTGALSTSSTYTLACTGASGTGSTSTTVSVAAPQTSGVSNAACTSTLNPGASLSSAVNSASGGAVICLNPGNYTAVSWSHGGTAGNPITITSANTASPATIVGRTVTEGSASYLNINYLQFQDTPGDTAGAVVLGTPHVNFVHNDVNGIDADICLEGVSFGGATLTNSMIDHNTIHDCEANYPGATADNQNEAQGVYMEAGPGNVITNNWCWNVSARCFQVRAEQGGIFHNNVTYNSGQGFIFGDDGAANNNVYNNIVGSVIGNAENQGYSAFEYNSSGSGNNFHDNCVSKAAGPFSTTASSNNTVVAVQFVNAAAHNLNLTSAAVNAPCQAYAVQGGNPGP